VRRRVVGVTNPEASGHRDHGCLLTGSVGVAASDTPADDVAGGTSQSDVSSRVDALQSRLLCGQVGHARRYDHDGVDLLGRSWSDEVREALDIRLGRIGSVGDEQNVWATNRSQRYGPAGLVGGELRLGV